jgi:hypothetical protein
MPEHHERPNADKVIRNDELGVTLKEHGGVTLEEWDNGKTVRRSANGDVLTTGVPGIEYTEVKTDDAGTVTTTTVHDNGLVETTTETQDGFRDTIRNDGTETVEQPGDDRIYEKDSAGHWTPSEPDASQNTEPPQQEDETVVSFEFGDIEIVARVPDDGPPTTSEAPTGEGNPGGSHDSGSNAGGGTGGGGVENESGGGVEGGDGSDGESPPAGGGGGGGGGGGSQALEDAPEHPD